MLYVSEVKIKKLVATMVACKGNFGLAVWDRAAVIIGLLVSAPMKQLPRANQIERTEVLGINSSGASSSKGSISW